MPSTACVTRISVKVLHLRRQAGYRRGIALMIKDLAYVATDLGRHASATRLSRAARAIRADLGVIVIPAEQALYGRHRDELRRALGAARFATAGALGGAMDQPAAIAEALVLAARSAVSGSAAVATTPVSASPARPRR